MHLRTDSLDKASEKGKDAQDEPQSEISGRGVGWIN